MSEQQFHAEVMAELEQEQLCDDLPIWKREDYAEVMADRADIERDRKKEEGV